MSKAIYIWVVSLYACWAALCCLAQWHTEAWTAYRGNTTAGVTNLQAFLVTDIWERVCTTNIPATDIPTNFPNIYTKFDGQTLPATNVPTDAITNIFYLDIRKMDFDWTGSFDTGTWTPDGIIPSEWTDSTWLSKYGEITATTDIVFDIVEGGVTNEYTTTMTFTRTYEIFDGVTNQVELDMTYDTQRQLDLYFAIDEREVPELDYRVTLYDSYDLPFYKSRWENLDNLKKVVDGLLPDYYGYSSDRGRYVIPMPDYSTWFSTPLTYDPITHQDGYEWEDTDYDGTNDTWVAHTPEHFPMWTVATFCLSNNLPIQLFTNTVSNTYWYAEDDLRTNNVEGWVVGEFNTRYVTNAVTWDEVTWGASYFDFTPPKNYFDLDADYHGRVGTNTWTLTWEDSLDLFARWDAVYGADRYGDTNKWDMIETRAKYPFHEDSSYPRYDFDLFLCASKDTDSVVTNLYIRVDQETTIAGDDTTNTLFEADWTNSVTNVLSVVLTNDYIAAGYDISDYDIQGLPASLNTMIWRDEYYLGDDFHVRLRIHWWERHKKTIPRHDPEADYAYRQWDPGSSTWDPDWEIPYGWSEATDSAIARLISESPATNNITYELEMWSYGNGRYSSDYPNTAEYQNRYWGAAVSTARGKYHVLNRMRVSGSAEIWMAGYAPEQIIADLGPPITYLENFISVYDDFGLGVNEDEYQLFDTLSVTTLTTNMTAWVETLDALDDIPTWVGDPDPHVDVGHDVGGFSYVSNLWRGVIFKEPRVLMKYDVINGFDYVE